MSKMLSTVSVGLLALSLATCGGSSPESSGGSYSSPPANNAAAASQSDTKVAGTDYNATGEIPCAMGGGAPTGSCFFGVKREGNGSGIVTVTKSDGRTRAIFFENGVATSSDASQADGGEFRAEKQSDMNIIHIGEERYEIPDAVILGG